VWTWWLWESLSGRVKALAVTDAGAAGCSVKPGTKGRCNTLEKLIHPDALICRASECSSFERGPARKRKANTCEPLTELQDAPHASTTAGLHRPERSRVD